jgi:hydroxymethylbilane synthase
MRLTEDLKTPIKIGSRKSDLARLQAYLVGEALRAQGYSIEYHFRESLGDKNLENPLWKMPEKGVFTEDFFLDLLAGRLDLVVHSWKDLPVEEKSETMIAATLPRADQRDLLLFKKSSLGKEALRIFSSSPRREKNLKPFLAKVIPGVSEIVFESVRGNVQTRVRKLLENPGLDGLIVAKAAMDRLLMAPQAEFSETKNFLRGALDRDLQWMVLPLEMNPNAPAQGALAIETLRSRQDLIQALRSIHCETTFQAVQKERAIFSRFGGGCHQKIGVGILSRPYGEIEIIRGEAPDGQEFHERKLTGLRALPVGLHRKDVEVEVERTPLKGIPRVETEGIWVARANAWPADFSFTGVIWAAGLHTWQKLAAQGVWVHGSAEGLGERENPEIEALLGKKMTWTRFSHEEEDREDAPSPLAEDAVSPRKVRRTQTYRMGVRVKPFSVGSHDIFHWRSYSQFAAALKLRPELKQAFHSCGPGRSFELIKKALGSDEKLFIVLG